MRPPWSSPEAKAGATFMSLHWVCPECQEFGVALKVGHIPDDQPELADHFDEALRSLQEIHAESHDAGELVDTAEWFLKQASEG